MPVDFSMAHNKIHVKDEVVQPEITEPDRE